MRFPTTPRNILLLKGHSAGVGDILRSSAAWRGLLDHYAASPDASNLPPPRLHVVMFSREPGYVSDALMASHHLLSSYNVVPKAGNGLDSWRRAAVRLEQIARRCQADLMIDCEPHGMRTTTLAWSVGRKLGVATLGIAEFPLRRQLYTKSSKSTRHYRSERGLPDPMDYTHRDFVVLSALGIERNHRPIELLQTPQAEALGAGLRNKLGLPSDAQLLGLNIGCGTPGAQFKRPALELLSSLVSGLESAPTSFRPAALLLTGAPFEQDVNHAFMTIHRQRSKIPIIDLAGQTQLLELPGVIAACRLFLSTDSGPFHMAVGLRARTLALFNRPASEHMHDHPWVKCVQLVTEADCNSAIAQGIDLWKQPDAIECADLS